MTEATASSRVTQENGARQNNGTDARAASGGNGAPARYSDADLEPIRARLAAFARGDFRPRGEPADDGHDAADPVLAEILQLADAGRRPARRR